MTVYGYIRVSTDRQTTENQRFEIEKHIAGQGFGIDRWINETISGTVSFKKRRLGFSLRRFRRGDTLICSELSRLGRTTLDVLTILNVCMEKGVRVRTVKENYNLGEDIQSQMLAFVFSMVAQIERTLISQRTKEALSRLKSQGTKEALSRLKSQGRRLGRPSGSKNGAHVWDEREEEIRHLLNRGVGKKRIAKIVGISAESIRRFAREVKPAPIVPVDAVASISPALFA